MDRTGMTLPAHECVGCIVSKVIEDTEDTAVFLLFELNPANIKITPIRYHEADVVFTVLLYADDAYGGEHTAALGYLDKDELVTVLQDRKALNES